MIIEPQLIIAVTSLLGVIGGGIAWVYTALERRANKRAKARDAIEEKRLERERALTERVAGLEKKLERMRVRELVFFRRIQQLEDYIVNRNLAVPHLDGWPPDTD